MIIDGFAEPFVVTCFIGDDKLYVALFHTPTLTHYHFLWDTVKNTMVGSPVSIKINCNVKNFPVKCFYNDDKDEIYCFYRQGQSYTIDGSNLSKWFFDDITDEDLGQMVLVYNKVLVIKSSGMILFFKMEFNEDLNRK